MPELTPSLPAPVAPAPSRRGEALRWALFRALERLSDLRGNNTLGAFALTPADTRGPALWFYVTTIGELNAVAPMIEWLTAQRPDLRPVLITEHAHYREAYLARLPQAAVSQQLARLRLDGLVTTRRDGRVIYYSIAGSEVSAIIDSLSRLFCAPVRGDPG